MDFQIREEAFSGTVEMLIEFEQYGRFLDMRGLKPASGGGDYLQGIKDWIKEKGLEQKFIEGYKRRRAVKIIPANVLNSIAWGIIKKRVKGKVRRRAWYNKSKSEAISDLFNQILANIPDEIMPEIKQSFKM